MRDFAFVREKALNVCYSIALCIRQIRSRDGFIADLQTWLRFKIRTCR
ncbi:hypothetical protein HMPREF9404_5119 [Eggerthella sp. HGA1]|nr:hypothetical protein HMPREF9404_5119 [Eggerthella sp. HGA1]